MHKKIIYFLLTLFAFCSCSSQPLCGNYISAKPSYSDYLFIMFHGRHSFIYITGSSLFLSADSSFEYKTCGNIMTGQWKTQNDSLYLIVKTNRYRIDSLNKNGFNGKFAEIPLKPHIYKIKHGDLLSIRAYNYKFFIDRMKKQ
ncbi:MAG: hypothetical protein JSS96_04555 [Bacteroidetes bacterium]|nr:hypothetical protein [Bacteroidota bacterium]